MYSAARKLAAELVSKLLGSVDLQLAGIGALIHSSVSLFSLYSAWALAAGGSAAVADLARV